MYLHVVPQITGYYRKPLLTRELLAIKLRKAMELMDMPEGLVLLTQDDVNFCLNFLEELERSLDEMPKDWRILHVCAGYMWGRKTNKPKYDSQGDPPYIALDPEKKIPAEQILSRRLARVFAPAWPGGPLAMLIRRKDIPDVLRDLDNINKMLPDDISLVEIAGDRDFMQLSPLLCYENEQGGTSLPTEGKQDTCIAPHSALWIALLSLSIGLLVPPCRRVANVIFFCFVALFYVWSIRPEEEQAVLDEAELTKFRRALAQLPEIPKRVHVRQEMGKIRSFSSAVRRLSLSNPCWQIQTSDESDVDSYLSTFLNPSDWELLKNKKTEEKTGVWKLLKVYREGGLCMDFEHLDRELEKIPPGAKCVLAQYPACEPFLLSAPGNPLYAMALDLNLRARLCGVTDLHYLGSTVHFHSLTNSICGFRYGAFSKNEDIVSKAVTALEPYCLAQVSMFADDNVSLQFGS